MARKAKPPQEDSLIIEVREGRIHLALLGTTPYLANRMAEKARRSLLLPSGRKNAAERQASIKHDPIAEFRAAPHTFRAADAPTLIAHPAIGFKKALSTAALDLPGTKKAQIGRLVHVLGAQVALYGIPQLHMAPVRSADMNRTPDIRTRAILPEWACALSIRYVLPILTEALVVRLVAAAGLYIGIGDFRSEKGAGDYGCWRICDPKDPAYKHLLKSAGREAQLAAMANPLPYDEDTEELFAWYGDEMTRRQSIARPAMPENGDDTSPDEEATEEEDGTTP